MSMRVIRVSRGILNRCRTVYWLCVWSFSFCILQLFSNSSNTSCFTSLPFTFANFFNISIALSTLPLVIYHLRNGKQTMRKIHRTSGILVLKSYISLLDRLQNTSVRSLFGYSNRSVTKIAELVSNVPIILSAQQKTDRSIEKKKPTLRRFQNDRTIFVLFLQS